MRAYSGLTPSQHVEDLVEYVDCIRHSLGSRRSTVFVNGRQHQAAVVGVNPRLIVKLNSDVAEPQLVAVPQLAPAEPETRSASSTTVRQR